MSELLTRIKASPHRATGNHTAIPLDVAVAWARDEVSHGQLVRTLNISSGAIYQKIAFAFRDALRKGVVIK